MVTFLEPLWLWAMAGVIVPLLLHLWNDRRGKVLPVGSVLLLQGAERRMSMSRRLTRWFLLLLRCLLLVLLAFLLAGPVFRLSAGKPEKGWVLITAVASPMADSLVAAGFEKHLLVDSNYWEGFVRADREAPAGVVFYVFTSGGLTHFRGLRPETGREVHWVVRPDSAEASWVMRAWRTASDSVLVSRARSKATATVVSRTTEAGPKDVERIDTALRIKVVADKPAYVRNLEAAVRAVGDYTKRRVDVVPDGSGDWLKGDTGWRSLVGDPEFPVVIEGMLFGRDTLDRRDRRVLDPGQVAPARKDGLTAAVSYREWDAGFGCWLFLLFVFILERIVSSLKYE